MPVRSRAARFLAVVVLLVVSGSVAGATATVPQADAALDGARPDSTAATDSNASDPVTSINQTIRIDVRANGDARWTLRMRATVANGSEVPLADLAAAYERGETDYLQLRPYESATRRLGTALGREMTVANISDRRATVANRTVEMAVSFTWTNFGERSTDRLVVRDVFNGTTGSWFPGLTEYQTLVVTPPEGYDISSVSTGSTLRNRTLRWYGPIVFGPETPYVVYVESGAGGSTTDTTPGPGDGDDQSVLVPAVVVLLVGLIAVLAVVASRTDGPLVPAADDEDDPDAAVDPADDGPDDPGDGDAAAADTGDDPVGEADDIDEQLLSDEERVERLLERNGGRMKQANIVSETDWSNAKVSQLLSSMADEGRIEKLRIGRENLISFPDESDDDDLP